MTQTRHQDKTGTPWFRVELNFEWYEGGVSFLLLLLFLFIYLFFCFFVLVFFVWNQVVKKDIWMRTISTRVMVIISKVLF